LVTADEIARVPVFAALDPAACAQLSRAAADVSLMPGEYAAHEGDERALFALLDGRVEVTKLVDGIERVIGERHVGDVMGEVPIALGTVFPVGFRAAEASRVMRVEPHDYHAVVALQPDVGKKIGRLAADRMGGSRGLQGIAAEPPPPRAIVVGHRWDASCAELRRFLDRNQITFTWLQPDDPDAAEQWGGPLPPPDDCPVIRVVDGKTVVRPQLRRVAELLGLGTEPESAESLETARLPERKAPPAGEVTEPVGSVRSTSALTTSEPVFAALSVITARSAWFPSPWTSHEAV